MRKRFAAALITTAACGVFAASASAAQLIYEPFDQNVSAGTPIVGLTNTASGNTWNLTGQKTPTNAIASGSLTAPSGFPTGTGNSATLYSAANTAQTSIEIDRLDIPNAFVGVTPKYGLNSTLYYSCLLQIPDLTGLTVPNTNLNANNDMIIAFNNSQGSSATKPTIWGGELVIRLGSTAGTYNLGMRASNTPGGTNAGHTYWTGDITANSDTHLIVASFARGNGAFGDKTNGTNSLWVDPSAASYGSLTAPAADGSSQGVMGSAGSDSLGTESLIIGGGIGLTASSGGTNPDSLNIDEIRVGETWRDVTSVPEPASLSLLGLGGIGLLSRRRRRR